MSTLLSIILALIGALALAALWYSRMLFGGLWRRLMRVSYVPPVAGGHIRQAIITLCALLVLAYALVFFDGFLKPQGFAAGARMGAWLWLGFVATTHVVEGARAGRPFALYAITAGYYLFVLAGIGGILAAI